MNYVLNEEDRQILADIIRERKEAKGMIDPRPEVFYDSIYLMRQLTRMAGMEWSPVRKMILVLEPDSIPVLYTEGYLDKKKDEKLKMETGRELHNMNVKHAEVQADVNKGYSVKICDDATKKAPVDCDEPVLVDTTNVQNEKYRTVVQLPPHGAPWKES